MDEQQESPNNVELNGTCVDRPIEPNGDDAVKDPVDDLAARLRRIADHRADLFNVTDAGIATLRGVTADLMAVQVAYAGTLKQVLLTEDLRLEDLEQCARPVETLFRATKLIAQMNQAELRFSKQCPTATPEKGNPK